MWVTEVQHFAVVVLDDPWEDWVLSQVQGASLGVCVQDLQVLKVRDLALYPLVSVHLHICRFCLASAWHVLKHAFIDLVALF